MNKGVPISETATGESRAGDVLLIPVALCAFWTLSYQLVLVARWPAATMVWCFFAIAVAGLFSLVRLWARSNGTPGSGYRFHRCYLLLFALGVAGATATLFVRRPNQDDIAYFHRVLAQLSALDQPIFVHETSVDMTAAAFSPLHLATGHEMLMGLLGRYLGIDPLYFYQVVGPVFSVFLIPLVLYWCSRRLGLARWPAAIGALLGITFLLLNAAGPASFGQTVFGRMWQGKAIVWILLLPLAICLTYRFLRLGNRSDLVWLVLLAIAGVGLSNTALYLIPAVTGCSCLSFLSVELLGRKSPETVGRLSRCCLMLAIPLVYPIAFLVLLKLNVIPQPTDTRAFGPEFSAWRQPLENVLGWFPEYLSDIAIMGGVPLLIVRGKNGLFLFSYLCAVWLLCLNPLLAHLWMHFLGASYFRLFYLLQLPLLCAMSAAAIPRLAEWPRGSLKAQILTITTLLVITLGFFYSYRMLSIMPRNPKIGIGWKSPREYQLLPANVSFAQAAGKYIAHSKLLAPCWTASCELPLLFPKMKAVAPRHVAHYFANAGNPGEGILRSQAQVFVEPQESNDPKRIQWLAAQFRIVIASGRANAVAVPESENARVLSMLQSIDPGWHRVLEAGGLVLMLPRKAEPESPE